MEKTHGSQPTLVGLNNNAKGSLSTNQLHKFPENDLRDTMLKMSNDSKETMAQVLSKAQESMGMGMRNLHSEW